MLGVSDVQRADLDRIDLGLQNYGMSWLRRGGVGVYIIMIRKADRISHQMRGREDLIRALEADRRAEGLIDDVRDLRTYLTMIAAHQLCKRGTYVDFVSAVQKDDACLAQAIPMPWDWPLLSDAIDDLDRIVGAYEWDVFRAWSHGAEEAARVLRCRLLALEASLGFRHDEVQKV